MTAVVIKAGSDAAGQKTLKSFAGKRVDLFPPASRGLSSAKLLGAKRFVEIRRMLATVPIGNLVLFV